MNAKLSKDIRHYVALNMVKNHIPDSEFKRLYSVFKGLYEKADKNTKAMYRQNMEDAFTAEGALKTIESLKEIIK